MSHTPHDALFKAIFSQPSRAMEELRAVLAPEVLRHLDLASAELVSGSFVDEALKERHTDLLFSLHLAGREAYAYFLFEHQSEPDALMVFRVLRYLTRIWERWLSENPGATRLPVIIPVVLTHAPGGWTAAKSLGALYDLDDDALEDFAGLVPDFALTLDDLSTQSDEALRARTMGALEKLVVLMLKHSRTEADLVQLLLSWSDLIEQTLRAPTGVAAFGQVVRYLLRVRKVDREELGRLLELKGGPKVKEAMMTTADELMQEGELKGRKKGMQDVLLRQLERRFGAHSPQIEARIRSAEAAQLERWSDRILTAATIDEVFAG